ncbi:hypothetical protein KA005_77195, partial [bacterium]|nr:hypothetical protein [bacterium]
MSDQTLRILLIDDRLGFQGTAKFLEWKLNNFIKESESQDEIKYQIEVVPERLISNLETRLKTEPFDLVLLDISFEKNEVKSEDSTEAHNNKEDLQRICE